MQFKWDRDTCWIGQHPIRIALRIRQGCYLLASERYEWHAEAELVLGGSDVEPPTRRFLWTSQVLDSEEAARHCARRWADETLEHDAPPIIRRPIDDAEQRTFGAMWQAVSDAWVRAANALLPVMPPDVSVCRLRLDAGSPESGLQLAREAVAKRHDLPDGTHLWGLTRD